MARSVRDEGCLRESELQALVFGTLEASAQAHEHLDACTDCQDVVAALVKAGSGTRPRSRPEPSSLPVGAIVGRYRIEEALGAGAMGVVYRAEDLRLRRFVAIKMLRDAGPSASLRHEARALARLSHPNVVAVYEVGAFEGRGFMAMELVRGTSLGAWLDTKPSVHAIVEVFAQAGRGLHVAHEAGIIHRDFKPANVLVGHDGRVRVVDFGLAHGVRNERASTDLAPGAREAGAGAATVTASGVAVGTPAYMAPEQHEGRSATPHVDQYAFSVALYEAVHGERPFSAPTLDGLAASKRAGELRIPPRAGVPSELQQAICRGLAPSPEARFPSMAAFVAVLAAIASGQRPGNHRDFGRSSRRPRLR